MSPPGTTRGARSPRLAAALLALTALEALAGCAGPPAFERDAAASDPCATVGPLGRAVRLGVRHYGGPEGGVHDAVLAALRRDPRVGDVQAAYRREPAGAVDYVLDLDYRLAASPSGVNVAVCFPGFLLLMPHWFELRWDLVVETAVRVERAPFGSPVGRVARRDRFEVAHSPAAYLVACDLGWLGAALTPALASPLAAGVVAATSDPSEWAVPEFGRSEARAGYGRVVAEEVLALLSRDLAGAVPEGGLDRASPRDLLVDAGLSVREAALELADKVVRDGGGWSADARCGHADALPRLSVAPVEDLSGDTDTVWLDLALAVALEQTSCVCPAGWGGAEAEAAALSLRPWVDGEGRLCLVLEDPVTGVALARARSRTRVRGPAGGPPAVERPAAAPLAREPPVPAPDEPPDALAPPGGDTRPPPAGRPSDALPAPGRPPDAPPPDALAPGEGPPDPLAPPAPAPEPAPPPPEPERPRRRPPRPAS